MWGFGFYLVLLGESKWVSLSLAWRRHAPSFPIYGMRRFVLLAAFFLDDGNFPLWWQKFWPQWSGTFFVHQVDLGIKAIDEQTIMGKYAEL